ncbi:MAG: hypothetical protein SGI74_03450 [Oligoflexia bacterium]|nr:hypothetical protein [Oligoflexia bacterium]
MGQARYIASIDRLNSNKPHNISTLRNRAKKSDQKLKHVFHTDLYNTDHAITGVENKKHHDDKTHTSFFNSKVIIVGVLGLVGAALTIGYYAFSKRQHHGAR